ncbi:hypothetical protein I7I53_03746 [Histoplasma capsulatum var. duboisii H88]|uniref:Uncharacterized protein n=1 Tax=Ajellomyces capsulatus (strain H88) TaxID=544711 RepID=A0A8A1LPA7_AJEC8|nr:hypothetical protein I7I53_03746 [Histoplasma capsulatum var. duboisii H88]
MRRRGMQVVYICVGARRSNPYAVVSWLAGIAGVLREGNRQLNIVAGNLETKFSQLVLLSMPRS